MTAKFGVTWHLRVAFINSLFLLFNMNKFYLKNFDSNKFLTIIKEKTKLNYSQIAREIKVSKSMIWRYNRNLNPLGLCSYIKLCDLANLKYNSFNFELFIPKNHNTCIILPKLDKKLSEFIGILLGDGHMSKKGHGIIITGGKADSSYITIYIPKLMKELFGKEPKTYILNDKATIIQSLIYSKALTEFFSKEYNIPIGKKKNTSIPLVLTQNDYLLIPCLRGLIDTDGGIYKHNNKSSQICFYNSCVSLLYSVKNSFHKLGFKPYFYWNKKRERGVISISGDDVDKYFEKIGFSNPKNEIKFKLWKKTGTVPKNSEIENLKNEIFL